MERLAPFSSADIADALVKLGVAHGGFLPNLRLLTGQSIIHDPKIVGQVYTVKMIHASDKEAPRLPTGQHFVDEAPAHSIVLISVPQDCVNAVWGGLMTTRAKHLGVRGVVIDGCCRDLQEQRDAGFPVFARGTSSLGANTFTRASQIRCPLRIGEVCVEDGDGLVADEDGVVCIPVSLVEAVAERCQLAQEMDARCLRDLQQGRSILDTFAEHRK